MAAPRYDPKKVELHELEPAVTEIIDEFLKLALPDSKFQQKHGEDAIQWSMVFRELPQCCAYHRMEFIANIQMDMTAIRSACLLTDCDEHITHDFLAEMILIIGKAMNQCVTNLMVKQMLNERRN